MLWAVVAWTWIALVCLGVRREHLRRQLLLALPEGVASIPWVDLELRSSGLVVEPAQGLLTPYQLVHACLTCVHRLHRLATGVVHRHRLRSFFHFHWLRYHLSPLLFVAGTVWSHLVHVIAGVFNFVVVDCFQQSLR